MNLLKDFVRGNKKKSERTDGIRRGRNIPWSRAVKGVNYKQFAKIRAGLMGKKTVLYLFN